MVDGSSRVASRTPVAAAFVAALVALPFPSAVPAAPAAGAPPECRCRVPGGALRELGTVECVQIGPRRVRVRCEMSTNTPYWRPVDGAEGCPAPA